MKRTHLNPISEKHKKEIAKERKLKKELIEENGKCCMKCGSKGDFRGIQLVHKIPKSLGGKTNRENCYLGCGKCHFVDEHGIKEVDSKPMWSKK